MTKRLFYALVVFTLALLQMNCASKKHVKTEVERIDKEMGKIEQSVEANETRLKEHDAVLAQHEQKLTDLSKESQEALQRANDAEKLAQGKLLYEVTLSDDKIKFALGKANLTDAGKEVLDNFISQLKAENKNVYIEIQGHTDSQGGDEYNMKLGQDRADTVRQYLSANGIPLHRISTISYGKTRPVADNKTKEGRSQNRRVVIQVLE